MRQLILLFFMIVSSSAIALNGFDSMRCKNQLIKKGDSIDYVMQQCGVPIEKGSWGNEVREKKYLVFKDPNGPMKHYMFFRDGKLLESMNEFHFKVR